MVLRSYLIPLQSNALAKAGGLQGNVVQWLGASLTPKGILIGALCEEAQAVNPTSGLILPGGAKAPEQGAQRWLFQVLGDGEAHPGPVIYQVGAFNTHGSYMETCEPHLAGYVAGMFIYVIRDRRGEPGVEIVKETA